ncbi:MAG: tetratricopeptide repeat protein [bacterium]|nr:tetratricopeptide repeat protein [bacterium]
MAVNKDIAAQLGRAWGNHRQGNNEAAISEFRAILAEVRDNADALYGLGLAQRAAGKTTDAAETFQRVLTIVLEALNNHPGEDRYEMLERMIKQRLGELDGGLVR